MHRVRIILLGLILSGFLEGCDNRKHTHSSASQSPFVITNQALEDGLEQWLIECPNGIVVGFQENNISIYLDVDSALTVWFDPTNASMQKTLLERPDSYIRDLNADGTPDLKTYKTDSRKEVFFGGNWYPRELDGTNVLISVDGNRLQLEFDGTVWKQVLR